MKSMTRLIAGAALLLGLSTVSALAQPLDTDILPDKGTREVGLAGAIQLQSPSAYTVQGLYGYFLNRNSEVGAQLGLAGASGQDTVTSLGGFFNYHFRSASSVNRTLPYVGAFLGVASGGGTDVTALGAQGGVKYFLNESVAFFGELNFRNLSGGIGDQTNLLFGLSIFLR